MHTLAPEVATFPAQRACVVYVEHAVGGTHLVPSVVHYVDMA